MSWLISFGLLIVFLVLLLVINRKNMGVNGFSDFAVSNGGFGFIAITLAIMSSWYVGSSFTAWASNGVSYGVLGMYVVPYATFCTVVCYVLSERNWVWGKLHGYVSLGDFLGDRYQNKTIRVTTSLINIVFCAPLLMLEWVCTGYIFKYATGGTISFSAGLIIGAIVTLVYVVLGGMRSVITANCLQGVIMIIGGISLFVFLICHFWGNPAEGYRMLWEENPALFVYDSGGTTAGLRGWANLVIPSALGAWMWPHAFTKTFASSSVKELKKSSLLCPILGGLFWLFLTMVSNLCYMNPYIKEHPAEVFFYISQQAGIWPLAIMSVIILAINIGTVSAMIQGCSVSFSRDIVNVFSKKEISARTSLNIARIFILAYSLFAIGWTLINQGDVQNMTLIMLCYQGFPQLFPPVILGTFWRKAEGKSCTFALIACTTLAVILYIVVPGQTIMGWSTGMWCILFNFIICIVGGLLNKNTEYADRLFAEFAVVKAKARKNAKAGKASA